MRVRVSGMHLKLMLSSFSKRSQRLFFFSLAKFKNGKSSLEECLLNNTIIYGLLMLQCKPYREVICQYIDPERKAGLCTPLKVAAAKLLYTEQLQMQIFSGITLKHQHGNTAT